MLFELLARIITTIWMKVYSKNLDNMNLWNEKDKADYISAIKQTLNIFFDGRSKL